MATRRDVLRMMAAAPGMMQACQVPRAQAQTTAPWPGRQPIRLVVPYSVGGAPDILARLFAQEMTATLGTTVVDNKGGAGGNLGADAVAKSPPDGYSLLVTTAATHAINPALYPGMPYDPVRDFTPIGLVASTPLMLVSSAAGPFKSLAEILAQATAQPDAISYASAGNGTMQHIAGELMASLAKVRAIHVPYRGSGQVMPDLIAGRVSIMFNSVAAVAPLVKEGRLRALAVTSPERLRAWPEVPTMAEAGLPGFEASAWYAVFGPAGMNPATVQRLNSELQRIVELPSTRARYQALGLEPLESTPQELGETVKRDLLRWTGFIKDRNIRADS